GAQQRAVGRRVRADTGGTRWCTVRTTVRTLESRFPAALFACGLVVLCVAAVSETGVRRLAVVAYLIWTLAEFRITFRTNPGETGGADRYSLQLYGLSRALVVAMALFAPGRWPVPSLPWLIVAVAVMLAGVTVRLTAIIQLGRFYSHKVRTLRDHEIVQTG